MILPIVYTYTSICDNVEYTNFQDCDREPSHNYGTTFLPRLIWMSRLAYTHSFLGITELLETLRCHCHRVASNHTIRSSRDEEKSLSKSRTVHHSVRSLALFLDRARWYDSRGGSRSAHRTMSITVRDFEPFLLFKSPSVTRLFYLGTRTDVRRSGIERLM